MCPYTLSNCQNVFAVETELGFSIFLVKKKDIFHPVRKKVDTR